MLADNTYVTGSFENRNAYVARIDRFGNLVTSRAFDFATSITPISVNTLSSLDTLGNLYVVAIVADSIFGETSS
jgi:hypothetical protein